MPAAGTDQPRSASSKVAYPEPLAARESELIARRRGGDHADDKRIGLALSGGGIRSATFAFGVIQALASRRCLPRIDFLSTVSGGGYTGGLVSRLFARPEVKDVDDVCRAILPARETGTDPDRPGAGQDQTGIPPGAVYRWLRENGRHLAPNGSGDLLLGGAIILRNWISIHVVLTTLVLAAFMLLQVLRNGLHLAYPLAIGDPALTCVSAGAGGGVGSFAAFEVWLACLLPLGAETLWWSPWVAVPALVFALAAIPFGWAYWLTSDYGVRTPRKDVEAIRTFLRTGRSFPRALSPLWGALFVIVVLLVAMLADPALRVAAAVSLLVTLITLGILGYALNAPSCRDEEGRFDEPRARRWLSAGLKRSLVILAAVFVVAMIDTLGQTLYAVWQDPETTLGGWLGALLGGLVAAAAGARRIAVYFSGQAGGGRLRPSLGLLSTLLAVSLFAVVLTAINALSHGVAWGFTQPANVPARLAERSPTIAESVRNIDATMSRMAASVQVVAKRLSTNATRSGPACPPEGGPCAARSGPGDCPSCPGAGRRENLGAGLTLLALIGLSLLLGRSWPFLNNSTLLPLYTARLIRAYLGASNARRVAPGFEARPGAKGNAEGCPAPVTVTAVIEDDDMSIDDRWWSPSRERPGDPFAKGAPLHLVNVTLNETLDGRSQVQQNDRKGVGMAVGPAGYSAGVRHHVVIPEGGGDGAIVYPPDPTLRAEPGPRACRPFRMFEYPSTGLAGGEPRVRVRGKRLSLGQWIGVSGAAFSTGIGSRTHLGLSLITGFFNVRLGYWWNSGVEPDRRGSGPSAGSKPGRYFTAIFPLQSFLLDELLARFHGTARRWWYLSDGGHFENMGGYELIRRRLPLIVIVDAEADPEYRFEGLANLVRKSRIDFDAEITFLDDAALQQRLPRLHEHFGSLATLRRGAGIEAAAPGPGESGGNGIRPESGSGPDQGTGHSRAHAALAEVRYEGGESVGTWLLYIKPTLLGNEPADVAHYHAKNPDFPQQTTADQFFDEAQWESYRKLGRLIAEKIFEHGFDDYAKLPNEPG